MNFGPQHPAAHGVLRLVLEMDGEVVERARSAYRPAASRHREADRVQDLPAGDALFRPARLRLADEPGARLRAGGREAARASRCRCARSISACSSTRSRASSITCSTSPTYAHGCRRDDAVPLGLRGAREADGVLRARVAARGCTRPTIRPGGVHQDLPAGLLDDIARLGRAVSRRSSTTSRRLLTENRIFKQRTSISAS